MIVSIVMMQKKKLFQFFSSEVFLSRICLGPISSMTFKVEENGFDKLLQLVKLRNVLNYQRFCITVLSSFHKKTQTKRFGKKVSFACWCADMYSNKLTPIKKCYLRFLCLKRVCDSQQRNDI
jgi:hypothetical protein